MYSPVVHIPIGGQVKEKALGVAANIDIALRNADAIPFFDERKGQVGFCYAGSRQLHLKAPSVHQAPSSRRLVGVDNVGKLGQPPCSQSALAVKSMAAPSAAKCAGSVAVGKGVGVGNDLRATWQFLSSSSFIVSASRVSLSITEAVCKNPRRPSSHSFLVVRALPSSHRSMSSRRSSHRDRKASAPPSVIGASVLGLPSMASPTAAQAAVKASANTDASRIIRFRRYSLLCL